MPGFNLSIGDVHFTERSDPDLLCNYLKKDNYAVNRYTLNKFHDDKIFYDSDEYFVLLEGVILNKKDYNKADEKSWAETVVNLYKKFGGTFYKDFRGSFSGVLYDKKEDKWIIFTDHIGSKHIYYAIRGKELYLSSEIADLYKFFKDHDINYSLDEQGAYMLLSYGYMLDDFTLSKEIRKLKPGSYIIFKNGDLNIRNYYTLPEEYDKSISEDDAVERVDKLFRNAIQLQFEKDREYNYLHLAALSGGLDSRMTTWVAHDMGYTGQLNLTFSQSDYLDETIAKEIAADLKHEWIFKALDNGLFLKNLDLINKISGAQALYYGLAHTYSMLRYLNFQEMGILHSGQLGDVIISSYIKKLKPHYSYSGEGAYSTKLLHKIQNKKQVKRTAKGHEQFLITQRGFNGINTGNLPAQLYTESMSPFYDISVLEYCLQVPVLHRVKHKLYKKWIVEKYPKAADYIWESTKSKISNKHLSIPYKGNNIPINKIPGIVLHKLGVRKAGTHSRFHMNPLDYWYKTNPDLKRFQDSYFDQHIDRLNQYPELKSDCLYLYQEGSAMEKNQVLTLLSALRLFFN